MSELLQSYKGTRDFYPEQKRFQKWMFGVIRDTIERYGYEEYDAPVLENTELFKMKGSDEIINEQSYTFLDRGDRSVTMRTEMTPSVSRMVAAKRQELAYPLRWYSIPNLWRYERPQRGRLREFWQPNVDIFGIESIAADFEIIEVADAILRAFKAKHDMYTIRVNSRKFMDHVLMDYVGLDEVESGTIRRVVDRKDKMEPAEFIADIEAAAKPIHRENGGLAKLYDVLAVRSIDDLAPELQKQDTLLPVRELFEMLDKAGIHNAVFDPTLMRGFDYYSDIVFEVFDKNPENNRSMFGGGRYDGLIGLFGVDPVPAVGFAMGDATLENFLKDHKLAEELPVETELYVALVGDVFRPAQKIIASLRQEGVKVAVDTSGRKLGKQIETADKKGIRYVMVLGEEEISSERFKLKDLKDNTEEPHSLERIVSLAMGKGTGKQIAI